jgi:gliding motility-associated-like protein
MRIKLVFLLLISGIFFAKLSAQYVVNGNAVSISNNCFRLTAANPFEGGSVWYNSRVDISQSFELYFSVFLGCLDAGGADGIAFVLQPISTGIGQSGGGLGYQGVNPSFALEIDTWQNPTDPSYDHVAIMSNGVITHNSANNLAGPVSALPAFGNIEDCQYHSLKISWNADSMIFRAYIDCDLRISYTGDIVRNIFNNNPNVFWGFTGATGGSVNEQGFCLEYISFTESMSDTLICSGDSVELRAGTGSDYLWSPGISLDDSTAENPIAKPTETTTYVVEIQDVCNAPRYDTITVFVDTPLVVDLGPDQVICRGDSAVLAPVQPYVGDYAWSTGDTTPFIITSRPGPYRLDVTNSCGTFSKLVRVSLPPLPQLNPMDIPCWQQGNGSATASSASTGPFTFQWLDANGNSLQTDTGASNSSQIQNLGAGGYQLIVTEGNGCSDTLPFQINEPPLLVPLVIEQTDILCHGDSTGRIRLTGSGGTPPYQYGLNGIFQTTGLFDSLLAGSYQVTIRDANGCDSTFSLSLSEPPPLSLSIIEQKNIDCYGNNNGRVSLLSNGGVMPYRYRANQGNLGASPVFSALPGGIYLFEIEDDNGCIDSIRTNIIEPDSLALSLLASQDILCNGDSTGWVRLAGQGGIQPFLFSIDGVNFGTNDSFPNLPANSYTAYIQDDSACVTALPFQLFEPPVLNASIAGILDVDCRGNATGAISVAASGGIAPYQYSTAGRPFSPRDTLDSLSVGMYIVRVQDSNACIVEVSAQVNEPAQDLSGSILSQQDVDCFGTANGSVTLTASGGTFPYQYSLNGRDFVNTPTLDSLSARPYTVIFRDSNGCLFPIPVVITSPTGLTSQLVNFRDVACHGDSSGSVTILGSGGTTPYQYSFDGQTFFPSAVLQNIPAGSYQGFLRDGNNCLVSVAFDIYQPDPLQDSIVWQKNVDCFGASTGAVRIGLAGGVFPYRYSIDSINFQPSTVFRDLSSGNYNITAVDDSGCVVNQAVQIQEPAPLVASIGAQANVPCFGDSVAFVELSVSGGVPTYYFELDSGGFGTHNTFTGLKAGMYQVVVRDDSACTDTLPIQITEPPLLQASLAGTKGIACFGDSSGYGVVAVSGGTPVYSYSLNGGPGISDSIFSSLSAGNYQVVIRDDSLCSDTVDFQLTQSPQLIAQVASTRDIPCYGDQTGGFTLSVSGGIMPYRFDRDGLGFGLDSAFNNLGAGNYTVTVQDDSLCSREFLISLTQPDSFTVQALGTDVLCFGDATGTGLAVGQGGVMPYSFRWNSNPVQNQAEAFGLPAGSYILTAQDSNLCEAKDTLIIDEPPLLHISLEDWTDAFCDWANGEALVSATGGVSSNYRFSWNSDPIQTEPNALNLFGGIYTATVTDENGCQDSISVPIGNTPPADPGFFTEPASPVLLSEAQIQFVNTTIGGVAYQWQFGDNVGSGEENPFHVYAEPGQYEVTLTAFNEYYVCPVDTVLLLTVLADGQLFLPNAFTPNGDGKNEIFYVVGEGVVEMEMHIFDRWGRRVALLQSLSEGWDGRTTEGGSAPEGVYTYRLEAVFNSGARINRSGTITLIR